MGSVVGIIPDDDIPFIFHHEEVDAMVFTHKGMWNEVQENIRKQAARLGRSRVSQPGPKASGLRNQAQPTAREARTANAVMVFRVSVLICAGMNARMKFGTLSESGVNALTVS